MTISPSVFTRFYRGWKCSKALACGFKTTPYSVKSATLLRSYEGIIVLTMDGGHIQAILGLDGCFPTCLVLSGSSILIHSDPPLVSLIHYHLMVLLSYHYHHCLI